MNCLMRAWEANEEELKGWLKQRASSPEQAEDWLQELFLKALQHKERFCTLDNARSWLFRLAHNLTTDTYRKHHPTLLDDILPEHRQTLEAQLIQDNTPPAPPLLELQTCMLRVLSELPPEERDVLTCCDIERMKQQEYARRNHLSLPAVKSRIQRARRTLRSQMVDACQIQFKDDQVCCFTPRP